MKLNLLRIVLPSVLCGVAIACGSSRGFESDAPELPRADLPPATSVGGDASTKDAAVADAACNAAAPPQSDPKNCGKCGHSCLGGTCAAGECKPSAVIVNLTEEPVAIAVDATNLYWITNGGSVMTCAIASCPVPTPLATGLGTLSTIAVDASYLYWTVFGSPSVDYADGAIMRASKTGTNVTKLAENQKKPSGLPSDGTNVYWAEQSAGGSVRACGIAGCGLSPSVISAARPSPAALHADDTSLFWTDQNTGEIVKTLKTGGAGAPLPLAQGQGSVVGVALDADNVYWGQFANPGKILKISKLGTGLVELAAGQPWPESIAVDESRIYWSTTNPALSGSVTSADKATGANPKVLATVAPFRTARSLVVDATSLYWCENGGRQIMRLAK